jgi:hypothetical protein
MSTSWTNLHGYWAFSVYGVERGSVSRIFRKVGGEGYIAEYEAFVKGQFDSLRDAKVAVEKAHAEQAETTNEAKT